MLEYYISEEGEDMPVPDGFTVPFGCVITTFYEAELDSVAKRFTTLDLALALIVKVQEKVYYVVYPDPADEPAFFTGKQEAIYAVHQTFPYHANVHDETDERGNWLGDD